jgi:hypothetical protein
MICTHRITPGCRISRLLVALPLTGDLSLCAKHLFVTAMMASPLLGAGAADCVSMKADHLRLHSTKVERRDNEPTRRFK